jgi:hypothetical protein
MGDGANGQRTYQAIVCGGFTAGVLDAILAVTIYHVGAVRVFRSVASGLLGRAAIEGGMGDAILGAILHFFIAFSVATVFVLAARKVPELLRRAVLWGPLFGAGVFFFMNWVVLPRSRYPFRTLLFTWDIFTKSIVIEGLLGHAFLIGLPIALFARHFLGRDGGRRSDGQGTQV